MDWFLENYRQVKIIESAIGLCVSVLLFLVVSFIPERRQTKRPPDIAKSTVQKSSSTTQRKSTKYGR